jgi:myosin heavy subunit
MAEKKVIELEVNTNLDFTVTALKKAQREVAILSEKFGATSEQAVEAAKKAAILKDKIGDAKALTDAFNPDAKFKALSGALTGVAGGFSVVTGALGAFGKQNEDVEKALLKVQSAMALASGAQAIGESIDSFKQLGAVIKANSVFQKIMTAAQYAYNLAMSLNPIGAIIAATIALIAVGYKLITMFQASEQANARNETAVKKNTVALKEQIKSSEKASEALKTKNGHEYEMAKASGASTKALRALALKHAEEEVALNKASLATAKNTYEKNKNTLANLINTGASDELIEKQREVTTEARKASAEERKDLEDAIKNKKEIVRKNAVEVRQELTDNNTKIKDANKALNEQIKQQNEEAAKTEKDRIKTLNDSILSLREEIRVSKLNEEQKEKDEVEKKYTKLIADAKKANLNVSDLEKEKQNALKLIREKYDKVFELTQAEKDAKGKEKKANEKTALEELTKSEAELKLIKLDKEYKAQQLLYKDNKEILAALDIKYAKDKEELEQEDVARQKTINEKKIQMAMDGLSIINDLFQMNAGKSEKDARRAFKAQKAFNLASAVTNTYLAVTSALATAKELFPGQRFIEAGLAGAAGAVQVAKIAKTQFTSSATSADTGGGGGGATAPTMSAPQFNVVGQSGVNQLASLNQQPIQAYVVSGQVTSQQALDRNRLANATLGG